MKVIAITNNSGGVGKTFITLHLAWCALEQGYDAMVLDADIDQANAVMWATGMKIKNPEAGEWYDGYGGLQIAWTGGQPVSFQGQDLDYLFIDGRPQLSVGGGAVVESNVVVIPIIGTLSVVNAEAVVELIHEYQKAKKIIIVMNQVLPGRDKIWEYTWRLAKSLKAELCPYRFYFNKIVRASENQGLPVWKVRKTKGMKAFRRQFIRLFDFITKDL
jgi:cellulose biosynthesis protein BcsQ